MKLFGLKIAVFILGLLSLQAQQDPLYSQYLLNMLTINPAYTGNKDYLSFTSLYRTQWLNVEGAPRTFNLTGDVLLDKRHVGVGGSIVRDEIGVYSTTTITGNYAYKILFKNSGVLSMGLSGSLGYQSAALSQVVTTSQAVYNGSDDEVFSGNVTAWLPNVGVGFFYNTDKFFAGISLPRTLNNSLAGNFSITDKPNYYRQSRHAYITTGYVFTLNQNYKLKPSILLRYVNGVPAQADLNCQIWAFDAISLGVSYRTKSSIIGILQMQVLPKLKIGYTYDYFLTKLSNKGMGAHEIVISYDLVKDKDKVISPRYF